MLALSLSEIYQRIEAGMRLRYVELGVEGRGILWDIREPDGLEKADIKPKPGGPPIVLEDRWKESVETKVNRIRMLLGNLPLEEIRARMLMPEDEFFLLYKAAEVLWKQDLKENP